MAEANKMAINIFQKIDDLAEKLSPEQKQKIKATNKFMYDVNDGAVSVFPLILKSKLVSAVSEGLAIVLPTEEKTLEKLSNEPLITMSKEEIEYQNLENLPNMYYPCISSGLPVEIKTAYFLLKTMAGKGIVNWRVETELYDGQKKHLGDLILAYGR